jgi:hypothetical protein
MFAIGLPFAAFLSETDAKKTLGEVMLHTDVVIVIERE